MLSPVIMQVAARRIISNKPSAGMSKEDLESFDKFITREFIIGVILAHVILIVIAAMIYGLVSYDII